MTMAEKGFYTVGELAELSGLTNSYISKLIGDGKLKALKEPAHGHGGFKYQIEAKEADRFLEARTLTLEEAKDPHSNLYVDRKELMKLTGVKIKVLMADEKIGRITSTRITSPGSKGFKYGYSVKEVKRYVRYLKSTAPQFITAEEMEELIKWKE